jgi:hypothetical protein|tara:strand:+ start:619 stop:894 length:276 start_codon:yes stop_codon:yes gene_type:complete
MTTKYNYKPKCRYCDKPGSKDCDTIYGDEPYNGNLIIVKEKKEILNFGKRVVYTTSVWDGETYKLNAGSFCTNRCAIWWANDHAVQPEEAE